MRLVTRSDYDGLACAVLLYEAGIVNDRIFVHPKDLQDGKFEATENDILANVPYVPGCGLWFDHHSSEEERNAFSKGFKGSSKVAPSAARVIYDYYGGAEKFGHLEEFMAAVDKADSAQFTREEILNPEGWVLLSFIMDPRTGLGRFRDYRISNYQLMDDMINYCRTMTIDEIVALPDVQERVKRYFEQNELFKEMLLKHTRVDENVIVTDLRNVDPIYSGNRFLVYSLFPEQNISVWIVDGRNKLNVAIAIGKSILNRTSEVNIGSLLLSYGGGGHQAAGTCQIPYDGSTKTINKIIEKCKDKNGTGG